MHAKLVAITSEVDAKGWVNESLDLGFGWVCKKSLFEFGYSYPTCVWCLISGLTMFFDSQTFEVFNVDR